MTTRDHEPASAADDVVARRLDDLLAAGAGRVRSSPEPKPRKTPAPLGLLFRPSGAGEVEAESACAAVWVAAHVPKEISSQ